MNRREQSRNRSPQQNTFSPQPQHSETFRRRRVSFASSIPSVPAPVSTEQYTSRPGKSAQSNKSTTKQNNDIDSTSMGPLSRSRSRRRRYEDDNYSDTHQHPGTIDCSPVSVPVQRTLEENCKAEIERLHAFFVDWFTGAVPRTDEQFERVSSILAPEFHFVSPRGVMEGQSHLLTGLFNAYGVHERGRFTIEIRNVRVMYRKSGICLMTYEQWQRVKGEKETARIATATFRESLGRLNHVEWLSVHETWLAGRGPLSGEKGAALHRQQQQSFKWGRRR